MRMLRARKAEILGGRNQRIEKDTQCFEAERGRGMRSRKTTGQVHRERRIRIRNSLEPVGPSKKNETVNDMQVQCVYL
jgi:hypothetical protein